MFLWCLTSSLYLSQQRMFPYIYADEYGVLGAGAVFAGLDWTAPSGMPFYGFLLSLMTFPVYWLDLEPTLTYRAIIAGNGVLVALAAVLAIKSMRLLFDSQSELLRAAIVVAAFSYPAVLHFSAMAMTESSLLFCFCLIAYHLAALSGGVRPRMHNAVLLGLGIALAQYAHPRGVAFVIAGVVAVLYAIRTRAITRKHLAATALSAVFFMLLMAVLKSRLLTTFYVHEHVNTSLLGFVDDRLAWLNGQALLGLVMGAFGQLTYLVTSSFGLFATGFGVMAFVAWNYFWRREAGLGANTPRYHDDATGLLATFVLLSFLAMFAASVLFLVDGERADHLVYGRYNEVMMPAMIAASLLFLNQVSKRAAIAWFLAGVFLAIGSLLLLKLYPAGIFQRPTIWLNITSWFVYKSGSWQIDPDLIIFGLALAFAVLTASFLVSRKLFVVVVLSFFCSNALFIFQKRHVATDRGWAGFNDLWLEFNREMTGMKLQATGAGSPTDTKGEALQFAFPNAVVGFDADELLSADAILDYGNTYCTEANSIAFLHDANFCTLSGRLAGLEPAMSRRPEPETQIQGDTGAVQIAYPGELDARGIEIGAVGRICSIVSDGYYTHWFRYCAPAIEVTLSQSGVPGQGRRKLGFFITDAQGKWLREWRVPIDNERLSRAGSIELSSSIEIPPGLSPGDYWLNMATIDASGWDKKSRKRVRLRVE